MNTLAPTLEEANLAPVPAAGIVADDSHDTLSAGLAMLLSLTLVQRLIGFLRSLLFCRMLDEDQLGQWSILFNFLVLAAPLAVLGIPGSFGRYAEHYRQRGQLRTFLRRTTTVTIALSLTSVVLLCIGCRWFSWLMFSETSYALLVMVAAAVLLPVIIFNFLIELFTALRRVRVVSAMHLVQSLTFAALGIALVAATPLGAIGVLLAYGAGCVLAAVIAAVLLNRYWRSLPTAEVALSNNDLWRKLVPFAGWVWVINLLANLFGVIDSYMLIHLSGVSATAAHALVGQYHSSRVIPLLIVGVAATISTVILPYLSHDWEAGRRRAVSQRLNLTLKLMSLLFTAGGALVLLVAPALFDLILEGRYEAGLAILPWTLIAAIWLSVLTTATNYLWCAEKGWLCAFIFAVGLSVNVLLNVLLVPSFALTGAVWAATAANLATLCITYWLCCRESMESDRRMVWASLMPLVLLLSPWSCLMAVGIVICWIAVRTPWLFSEEEQDQCSAAVQALIGGQCRAALRMVFVGRS